MAERRKPKHERTANFTSAEIQQLVLLVKQHQKGVNCNETGVNKSEIRKETWEKISQEYNSKIGGAFRSAKVLQTKYKNIKCSSAKKFADVKANYRGTGGGPPKHVVITDVDETIKEIHGPQVTGQISQFDDDLDEESPDETGPNQMELVEVNVRENEPFELPANFIAKPVPRNSIADVTESDNNWTSYTPQQLRKPVSSPLKQGNESVKDSSKARGGTLKSKVGNWAKTKIELAELQKTCFMKEHELKIKQMQEKHEKAMSLLQAESDDRRMFAREEHNIKKQKLTST